MAIFANGSSIPMGLHRLWPDARGRVGSQQKTKPLDVHQKHETRRTRIRPSVVHGESSAVTDRGVGDGMVTWKEFAAAERDLAETGRSLLLHKSGVGLAFLATVRKDGAPRLHPLCPVLSDDRLFVLITPASPKRHDLLRDGRYALQTFSQPKPGSDEFYVAGKAILVENPAVRGAVFRDAKHMANASEVLFELWIDRVMHTRWENVLTPQMRPVHRKWRAPGAV